MLAKPEVIEKLNYCGVTGREITKTTNATNATVLTQVHFLSPECYHFSLICSKRDTGKVPINPNFTPLSNSPSA